MENVAFECYEKECPKAVIEQSKKGELPNCKICHMYRTCSSCFHRDDCPNMSLCVTA